MFNSYVKFPEGSAKTYNKCSFLFSHRTSDWVMVFHYYITSGICRSWCRGQLIGGVWRNLQCFQETPQFDCLPMTQLGSELVKYGEIPSFDPKCHGIFYMQVHKMFDCLYVLICRDSMHAMWLPCKTYYPVEVVQINYISKFIQRRWGGCKTTAAKY